MALPPATAVLPRRWRWVRNVFFLLLCLGGIGALAGGLLAGRSPRVAHYRLDAYEQPSFTATLEAVDSEFRQSWKSAGLEPTSTADSLQVARRLCLALCGTVPSVEELRALERVPEDQRVAWWTESLLRDPRYADYFAERLARAQVGTEDGPFVVYRRRRFVTWLSSAIAENRPYDQIVRQLISERGTWTDSPAVNFITVTSNPEEGNKPDEVWLAGRVCRAFLGIRIDCLQCHDDHLGTIELGPVDDPESGLQSHFHQLAAFFSEVNASLMGIHDSPRPYEYQYLEAPKAEIVEPRPPFLPHLLPEEGTRRERLAAWVTHPENRPFARATVNRVWALMFGRPLVEPIDDIPLYGAYPPGLEVLAEDFSRNGYDLRRLIRLIAVSEVFHRDSRAEYEITPEHEAHWAAFPLSRLRPDQVAGALLQACSLKAIDAQSHVVFRLLRFAQQHDFVTRYGDTGEDELSEHGGTVTQRLMMMNGDLVTEKTSGDLLVSASTQIARYAPDPPTAVETAYLAVLSRQPTEREREHFAARVAETDGGDSAEALHDLYWVLVNSTEFSWNH